MRGPILDGKINTCKMPNYFRQVYISDFFCCYSSTIQAFLDVTISCQSRIGPIFDSLSKGAYSYQIKSPASDQSSQIPYKLPLQSKIDQGLTEADEFDPLHNMTNKGLFWRKLKLQFVGVYLEGSGRIPQSTFS